MLKDTRIFKTQPTCLNNPNRNPTTKLTPTQKLYIHLGYYDPAIGRLINADGYASTGQGVLGGNMFTYCGNNPVNRVDPNGCFWWLIAVVVGVIVASSLSGCTAEKPTLRDPGLDFGEINDIPYVPKASPTKTSDAGVTFITDYEGGFSPTPYDDGYGNMTIGYGHVIRPGENFSVITEAEGRALFAADLAGYEHAVTSYAHSIGVVWDQNQYDALVSLAYNAGPGAMYDVVDSICGGMSPHAAFGMYIKAGNPLEVSLGLYRRRVDEANMFAYGTYARTYPSYPG